MLTENEGDRLMARVLGRDLQGATIRLALYGLAGSAIAATILVDTYLTTYPPDQSGLVDQIQGKTGRRTLRKTSCP